MKDYLSLNTDEICYCVEQLQHIEAAFERLEEMRDCLIDAMGGSEDLFCGIHDTLEARKGVLSHRTEQAAKSLLLSIAPSLMTTHPHWYAMVDAPRDGTIVRLRTTSTELCVVRGYWGATGVWYLVKAPGEAQIHISDDYFFGWLPDLLTTVEERIQKTPEDKT